MQQEIGHFESCSGVAHPLGLLPYDPQTYWTCMGGREPGGTGEGPCDFSTGTCTNPTTEGGGSCPSGAFNCEFSDALCAPATPRPVTLLGNTETWQWPVAGCEQDITQNGDLDFDGNAYTGIEAPCAADFLPSWFKFRLFLQWHKELPGERFDRSSLGFLLSSTARRNVSGKAKGLPISSAYGRELGGSMELRSQYTPQVNPYDQPFFTPFASLKNRFLFPSVCSYSPARLHSLSFFARTCSASRHFATNSVPQSGSHCLWSLPKSAG